MRRPSRAAAAKAVVLVCVLESASAACGEADRTETSRADSVAPVATVRPPESRIPGLRFDPAALRPGTAVGELVADSVAAHRTPVDSTYVGVARFRGQMELSGWTMRHFDADLENVAVCFEADSTSATRLPRWSGDERRPWFCFVNRTAATRALGPPSGGLPATIVIERFTIHRGHSDEVNSARFVRRVARCYRSSQSVLFGPATQSGQQGQGPGWLRLEGSAAADSGQGELVDADRKGLGAFWRRGPGDSVSVVAFHHNFRVELRLVVADEAVVGPARARSDATVERDSAGRLRDLQRAWVLRASRASCDSMPVRY